MPTLAERVQKLTDAAKEQSVKRTVIPAEAVEAAAKAHLEARGEATWRDLTKQGQNSRLHWMRAALEAAAPHLMAAAWDEGYEQADYDAPHSIKSDNPYRKYGPE